jgi:type I restriction enzyme S subunit
MSTHDWAKTTFGEICTITRGASPRPIMDWVSTAGTPWVKISDATGEPGRFISQTKEFIKDEGRSKSVVVYPGDLVVSNSATPGLPKFLRIEACVHDGWLLLRNFNGALPEFLYYVVLNDRKTLVGKGSGSVFTNLKTDILKNHEIALPGIPEQKRISDTLGQIDDLIALNASISKSLEDLAKAIFKSWFIDFDPIKAKMAGEKPVGIDAATAELFPDSMEESGIGLIPKGWGVYPASELFEVGIGRTPPRKEPQWFCKGTEGIPWVSIRDMGTYETYSHGTNEGLTQAAVEKFKVPIVPENTVLMSFKLTVGKLCISDADLVTNEAIAHFRISEDSPLNTFYTYLWLSNLDMGSLDSTSSIGTATNSGVIKQIKFLVPPQELLGNFHEKVSPIFSQLKLLRKQTTNLVLLRDSLLPRLISGELLIPEEMLAS